MKTDQGLSALLLNTPPVRKYRIRDGYRKMSQAEILEMVDMLQLKLDKGEIPSTRAQSGPISALYGLDDTDLILDDDTVALSGTALKFGEDQGMSQDLLVTTLNIIRLHDANDPLRPLREVIQNTRAGIGYHLFGEMYARKHLQDACGKLDDFFYSEMVLEVPKTMSSDDLSKKEALRDNLKKAMAGKARAHPHRRVLMAGLYFLDHRQLFAEATLSRITEDKSTPSSLPEFAAQRLDVTLDVMAEINDGS